jgi:hypothetical protein
MWANSGRAGVIVLVEKPAHVRVEEGVHDDAAGGTLVEVCLTFRVMDWVGSILGKMMPMGKLW